MSVTGRTKSTGKLLLGSLLGNKVVRISDWLDISPSSVTSGPQLCSVVTVLLSYTFEMLHAEKGDS